MSHFWEQHPGEEVLEVYARGSLKGLAWERVEMHLLICEVCQRRVSALDVFVASMRAVTIQSAAQAREVLDSPAATSLIHAVDSQD